MHGKILGGETRKVKREEEKRLAVVVPSRGFLSARDGLLHSGRVGEVLDR